MRNCWDSLGTLLCVTFVLGLAVFGAWSFDRPADAQPARPQWTIQETLENYPLGFEVTNYGSREAAREATAKNARKAVAANFATYMQACAAAQNEAEINAAFRRWQVGYLKIIEGTDLAIRYQTKVYDAWEASRE